MVTCSTGIPAFDVRSSSFDLPFKVLTERQAPSPEGIVDNILGASYQLAVDSSVELKDFITGLLQIVGNVAARKIWSDLLLIDSRPSNSSEPDLHATFLASFPTCAHA